MQISEAAGGVPVTGAEPCRFPKLEECAHFHYERVQLPQVTVTLQTNMDYSLHSQHTNEDDDTEWFMVQVTSGDQCWLLQRNFENFKMLDEQLHQCIFDRKISLLPDMAEVSYNDEALEMKLKCYLERFSNIADNSVNCGPVLNWLQMDNKGHRLLVPSEESRSINTPAVAAAYSVRRYVSQARDELNLEVGDMISVIDMASPGESMWWRGKRGFQVGFFPQHCVHIIGDKIPRNMPLPPPVVGPSRRRLKQSGILKERVFGCDLGEHLLNSGHQIPMVLKCCAEFIEKKGIVDGIYRLSGITSNIQKLRNAFDEDRIPNLYTEEILQDIHSVASLLKMYFRELPNPLCTYQLYQSFVNAVQGCGTALKNSETDHERLLKMREAVQKLPPPHYRTLEYLMRHLARVAKHGASTGMTTRNVAIVWAPNLLRCEELEIGGVAALQGVGVQAVVTEFLICYANLIFCDHLPKFDLPDTIEKENLLTRKCRPNSLAISTPTKLITLEEARNKHLVNNKSEECSYIEVGGGPKNLPKKYHTVIELPSGSRKRGHTKRSPLGWRMFFTRSRNSSQSNITTKNRKSSTPITANEKSITESDLTDMKRKLRTVKSAESLTSGHSEPASCEDVLGPLQCVNKPPGHNRSVSHDSYFDTLQNSQNNSEASLLDLSEIRLNFDLEESEMHIFSEDESLVSSPKVHNDAHRRISNNRNRTAEDDYQSSATNSMNPSPKKQPRVILSPDSMSRKRTRLEDQLSDIQYIDCSTPDNTVIVNSNTTTTAAIVHAIPSSCDDGTNHNMAMLKSISDINNSDNMNALESYQPKNKSPRNSCIDEIDSSVTIRKRQSLNLDCNRSVNIPKSFTEHDIALSHRFSNPNSGLTTPGSPGYRRLVTTESSANTSPLSSKPTTPSLTTISITYKSPPRSVATTPIKSSPVYENIVLNAEQNVDIPTSMASLPVQEASQPKLGIMKDSVVRPKSLSALGDDDSTACDVDSYCCSSSGNTATLKANSSSAICNTSDVMSLTSLSDMQKTLSSNQSSGSNIQYTASLSSDIRYQQMPPLLDQLHSPTTTDQSLSEVVPLQSYTEDNLSSASQTSLSFPISTSKNSLSPIVSPTTTTNTEELVAWNSIPSVNLIEFSPVDVPNSVVNNSSSDKRKSDETESLDDDDNAIYQQVKYFRRSIHEVNAMLDLKKTDDVDDPNHIYEDIAVEAQLNHDNGIVEEHELQPQQQEEEEEEEENQHVYENLQGEDMRSNDNIEKKTEEISIILEEEQLNVKDLKSRFEEKIVTSKPSSNNNQDDDKSKTKKFFYYEKKDSLPPCLRARNLKHQLKTRSLDEDEFEKECLNEMRRKSMDDGRLGYHGSAVVVSGKTSSLPKMLNPPKALPLDCSSALVNTLHMSHSHENLNHHDDGGEDEEQKKRERIEKYKEERRRVLHEKYRSESFKEDKDVLLSRLKIFKPKDSDSASSSSDIVKDPDITDNDQDKPTIRVRRKSTRSECGSTSPTDSLETISSSNSSSLTRQFSMKNASNPEVNNTVKNTSGNKKEAKQMTETLKSRAAIFEQKSVLPPLDLRNKRTTTTTTATPKEVEVTMKLQNRLEKFVLDDEVKDLEFIRNKAPLRSEDGLRRHTYESRERESEAERLKRVSLDSRNGSQRKERASPTYCIKDMKAIFESKSKQ